MQKEGMLNSCPRDILLKIATDVYDLNQEGLPFVDISPIDATNASVCLGNIENTIQSKPSIALACINKKFRLIFTKEIATWRAFRENNITKIMTTLNEIPTETIAYKMENQAYLNVNNLMIYRFLFKAFTDIDDLLSSLDPNFSFYNASTNTSTALNRAVSSPCYPTKYTKYLLELGANPNKPDGYKKRPLDYVFEGAFYPALIELLVTYGADLDLATNKDSNITFRQLIRNKKIHITYKCKIRPEKKKNTIRTQYLQYASAKKTNLTTFLDHLPKSDE